jgi:hypothetical protein
MVLWNTLTATELFELDARRLDDGPPLSRFRPSENTKLVPKEERWRLGSFALMFITSMTDRSFAERKLGRSNLSWEWPSSLL